MTSTWNNQLWKESISCAIDTLKSPLLIPLFGIHFALFAVSQGSIYFQQYRMSNPRHDDMTTVITIGVLGIIIFLFLSVFWLMISAKAAYNFKANNQLKLYFNFNQTSIEYMRSLVSSLCYGFLLLIPGITRFIQLTFAPYISMFDEAYENNQVDALDRSKQILKGRILMLGLIWLAKIIFSLAIESFLTMNGTLIDENPVGVLLNQILQLLINLVFTIYTIMLYFKIAKANSHATK